MIYDEGFEFKFNTDSPNYEKYFAFSKYGPNEGLNYSSSWVSYCYQTLVGWYNIGNSWGCFYGNKEIAGYDVATNGEAENKQVVTENSILFVEKKDNIENINDKVDSFLKISKISRFTETENSELLVLDSNFKDHSKLVERINSANLSWKAKNYKEFEGLTRAELKKVSKSLKISNESNRRKKKNKNNVLSNNNSKSNSESFSCPVMNNKQIIKYEDLPESFDAWEKFMTPPGSQVRISINLIWIKRDRVVHVTQWQQYLC
jgi:hypothetical protein